ncbi:MAG: tetratricopeptide repeat protein [Acidobacteriota bacterium]|nr:tetratricopeptide repeat protein [Acidobacteriota bacterium]MDH3784782.1 tetratricopeptide repeat protein [Acidobacteriota bacterium]
MRRLTQIGVAIACALAVTVLLAGPHEEADAAYRGGDHARALDLYERAIAAGSQDLQVWLMAARLHSWQGDLDRSIARYDQVVSRWPDSRDAALGRATVLAWDGRHQESIESFESLLARSPDDREVELGLARTLSWDGSYDRARSHYANLLSRDEGDVDALVGTGSCFAWEGRHRIARTWYERALALDPDNRDAEIGRAYLDLWSGGIGRATRRTRELEARHPDDREVLKLARQVDDARAPVVRVWVDQLSDTDDNTLDRFGVRAGWRVAGGTGLVVGAARFDMQDPTGEAAIDAIWAALTQVTGRGSELTLHAGVDRLESTTGEQDSEFVGELSHLWGTNRRWQFQLRARRSAVRYSPTITDNRILFDDYTASTRGQLNDRWRLALEVGTSDVSDGNKRDNALASVTFRVPTSAVRLELGYTARYFDYSLDLDNGYFDPEGFFAHGANIRLRDTFGRKDCYYELGLAIGLQSFERSGVKTTNDVSQRVDYLLGIPIGRANAFEFYGDWGDYAAQNAGGFESRLYGLRWVWRGVRP